MDTKCDSRILLPLSTAIIGLAVGRLLFDHSAEIATMRSKLSESNTEIVSRRNRNKWESPIRAFGEAQSVSGTSPEAVADREEEFDKLMTQEDWMKTYELDRRAREGEYVLQYERPYLKRRLELLVNRVAAETATQNAVEYAQEFAKLGVEPELAQQLMKHVEKITKASMESEASLQQLLFAKHTYEDRLRSVMGDDKFSQYRQYEEAKPAIREYQNLQTFLGSRNASMDPAFEQSITQLIQDANAYTEKSWRGPFEGTPDPGIGRAMVISQLEQSIGELTERANTVLKRAAESGVPDAYNNLLADYYTEKIQQKQQLLENVKNPHDEDCSPPPIKR